MRLSVIIRSNSTRKNLRGSSKVVLFVSFLRPAFLRKPWSAGDLVGADPCAIGH
jgi:hypothetical protein